MQLFNSMGKQKQEFTSNEKGLVKIFSCGPSVYQKPHIGNYRTFLYEDLTVRYLEYKGYKVMRSQNLTDIEDKAVSEAMKNGKDVYEQTMPSKKAFEADMELLRIKKPIIAMASTSVKEAIFIIEKLIEKGIAYNDKGSVFFDPLKIDKFGKLYGIDMSKFPAKKRKYKKDTYPGNNWNLGDFILWHKADDQSNTSHAVWKSPWGMGRPSWNIQDPAMIYQTLGDSVDINCGGIDNIIRHHDYNIAIMENTFNKEYAKFYMHGAHLYVDSKKMSKSKGNIIYPNQLVEKGFKGTEIRFFLLGAKHYRQKLNYTETTFDKVCARRRELLALYNRSLKADSSVKTDLASKMSMAFESAMDDDLSVKIAVDNLIKLFKTVKSTSLAEKAEVEAIFSKMNEVLQLV